MKKENSLLKTTVISVVIAVIAVAAVVFILASLKNGRNETVEPLTKYTVSQDKDENTAKGEEIKKYLIFTDENGESTTIDGEDYMANLAEDRFIIVKGRELVYFADGKAYPLSQNTISCSISNNGLIVGFIEPNSDEKIYEGTLYIYNTATSEIKAVCDNAFVSSSNRIQISPSGDVVAYTKNYDADALTYDCCYYENGKETVFGENRDIQAISDKAEYIYYTIEDPEAYSNIFAVYTKKNGEVILDEEAYNKFYLNLDYSECVFYKGKEDTALYISRNGSEGEDYLSSDKEFDTSSLVPHVNSVINVETFE